MDRCLQLIMVLALLPTFLFAQQMPKCGFDKQCELHFRQRPHALNIIRDDSEKKTYHQGKYIIPVVVHVFSKATNRNDLEVTYELVKDALKTTSEDFQGLTADYNQNDPSSRFEDIKKPLDIEFRLATKDPFGCPTRGVLFYDEEEKGFGNGGGYDERIQHYAWDNTRYMNIYIMRDLYADSDFLNSGVSWLPDNWMTSENLARVVYNGSYLGKNTTENFRRVLTHEFGHFMWLRHTFDGGCSYPNDGIEDTPPVAESHWPKDEVNCEGNYTDWENFMNYTEHYRHYTAGQVALMEHYLNEVAARRCLWQSDNLIATGTEVADKKEPCILIDNGRTILEKAANDGSVQYTLKLLAFNGMRFAKTGELVAGKDYELALPEGLTASLVVLSDTKAELRIGGRAVKHDKVDNQETVGFKILSSALQSDVDFSDQQLFFSLNFRDPYTDYCQFSVRYSPYAYISRVKMAQIDCSSKFNMQTQYVNHRKDYIAGLEPGKTYPLEVTVVNQRSGATDGYTVRAWFDWNADFVLQSDELVGVKSIDAIGEAGTSHVLSMDVKVPEVLPKDNTVFGFRVMLHFTQGTDGEDPCGEIDSGDVEDYGAIAGEENAQVPSSIAQLNAEQAWVVTPNPAKDILYIRGTALEGFQIYSQHGICLLQGTQADITYTEGVNTIDIGSLPAGMYVLQLFGNQNSSHQILVVH